MFPLASRRLGVYVGWVLSSLFSSWWWQQQRHLHRCHDESAAVAKWTRRSVPKTHRQTPFGDTIPCRQPATFFCTRWQLFSISSAQQCRIWSENSFHTRFVHLLTIDETFCFATLRDFRAANVKLSPSGYNATENLQISRNRRLATEAVYDQIMVISAERRPRCRTNRRKSNMEKAFLENSRRLQTWNRDCVELGGKPTHFQRRVTKNLAATVIFEIVAKKSLKCKKRQQYSWKQTFLLSCTMSLTIKLWLITFFAIFR